MPEQSHDEDSDLHEPIKIDPVLYGFLQVGAGLLSCLLGPESGFIFEFCPASPTQILFCRSFQRHILYYRVIQIQLFTGHVHLLVDPEEDSRRIQVLGDP